MSGAPSPFEPEGQDRKAGRAAREGAKIIDLATRNALPQERPRPRDERLGMFAGLAVVALLTGMTVWTIRESEEKPARPSASGTRPLAVWPGAGHLPAPAGDHKLAFDIPQATAPATASSLPPPDLSPVLANPTVLPEVAEAPLAEPAVKAPVGPTVVFEGGTAGSAVGFAFEPGAGNEFGGAVKPDRAAPSRNGAGRAAIAGANGDPARTLGKGTLIPAILETAIDSKVPGGVRAVVSTDVLSPDGKRSLVPRSSRLIGQYKTRRSAGQTSTYVIWTQIVRPDGVKLDIPSSAAGAGERQFFDRFGAEKLVSVIAGQSGADMRARQGEPVRVMAARDVELPLGR